MPIYIKRTNPTDEVVNNILKEGYTLHSITPITIGHGASYLKTELIYHFIKEVAENYMGINFYNDDEMPNPFEPPRFEK